MAATLSLDTITSSGSTITVPTGKTLAIADAGALTLGTPPVAITTGAHVTATSSANPTTIASGDITGKSNYALVFDASTGTSTEFVVNLPAPADFQTTVITVRSNVAHGSGNKITIKDSGVNEVYTLYNVNDYSTFISDGTNTIRTGDEYATVRGHVALTGDQHFPANTYSDLWNVAGSSGYSVEEDYGGGWSTTTDDFSVPHTGLYWFGGHYAGIGYTSGLYIYKDGTQMTYGYGTDTPYGYGMTSNLAIPLTAGDVITWYGLNNYAGTGYGAAGRSEKDQTQAMWWMIRRS